MKEAGEAHLLVATGFGVIVIVTDRETVRHGVAKCLEASESQVDAIMRLAIPPCRKDWRSSKLFC